MAKITAAMVKELRETTGAGMMDCKKALTATEGDKEKAIDWLREKGISKAEKKAGRIAAEGAVAAYISDDAKVGVLVEVNCETDFAAGNEQFRSLEEKIAKHIAATNPADLDALNASEIDGKTVAALVTEATATIGEKISLRRFVRYETEGRVASYIHMGGKVGVLLSIKAGKEETVKSDAFKALAKDLTLHIAAAAPKSVSSDSLDPAFVAEEQEIAKQQLIQEGKPEHLLEKILPGKLKALYAQSCLLNQGFVKDPSVSVDALLKQVGKELGDEISVVSFVRYQLGA
mgnify:CR=1 FL=1